MKKYNFIGTYKTKIYKQHKISIPKSMLNFGGWFKEFVIKKDLDTNCLVVYPIDEWNEILKQLKNNSKNKIFNKEYNNYIIDFLKNPHFSKFISNTNRLTIPIVLYNYFKNEDEIIILGIENRIELWPLKSYNEYLDHNDTEINDLNDLSEKVP